MSKKAIAAGALSAVVAVGVAAPSFAHGNRGDRGERGYDTSAAPRVQSTLSPVVLTAEQQTYVDAVVAARTAYKSATQAAEVTYKADKRAARTAYLAAIATATSDADRTTARNTYKTAIATAKAVKFAARQAAATVRDTTIATAATAYNTATGLDASTIPVPFGKKY